MNETTRKGVGLLLTGGLSILSGALLLLTGTLPPWEAVIGTMIVTVANIFGIVVIKPK